MALLHSVFALVAALSAGSVALAGFRLEPLIEIRANMVVVSHLKDVAARGRQPKGLRVIGVSFLMLSVHITAQSSYVLATGAHPRRSILASHPRGRPGRRMGRDDRRSVRGGAAR